MQYDTTNPRYEHLAGLTEREIATVMILADICMDLISDLEEKDKTQIRKTRKSRKHKRN